MFNRWRFLGLRAAVLALLGGSLPAPCLAQSGALLIATAELNGGGPTIRKVSLSGEDLGVFISGGLNDPLDLTIDRFGNLYVSNLGDGTIRRFSPTGADLGVFAVAREPIALALDPAGDSSYQRSNRVGGRGQRTNTARMV